MTISSHEHEDSTETEPAPAFYTYSPQSDKSKSKPRRETLFKSSENLRIGGIKFEAQRALKFYVAAHY